MSFSLYNRFRQLEKVRVDKDALEGYLGATSTDGVLRISAPLTYTDGGNYITLGLDTAGDYTVGSITFAGATGTNLINMPDNLLDALSIQEGSNKYVTFDTVDDEEDIFFYKSVDILHTATHADDHALEVDTDAAGHGDVKAIDIDYITGDISTGEDEGILLLNIDRTLATGGDIFALEVLATDQVTGITGIYGLKIGPEIGPVHQDSGEFIDPTLATNDTPRTHVGYMADGILANTTDIFKLEDDYIIISANDAFQDMELVFSTPASKNIRPTFHYSISGIDTFAEFTPVDGTDGCRHTGVISWDADDVTGGGAHVADSTTGKFAIKIIRTKAGNMTTPVLGYAKTAKTAEYVWDEDGDVNIRKLAIGASSGTFPGASFHLAAPTGNINAYITNDAASGIPALWLIRGYTGTPSYGGIGSTGNDTLELSTTGSFNDSGFILAGNDVTIVGTLDCGAITSSGNLLITSASSKSIITTVTEIAEITECILNSDTASWSTFSKGSAYAGTTHGGLTGNNQVGMEAQNASSFYIGCNAAAPIIFCQGRVEKVRIDTSGNFGLGTATFGTNAATSFGIAIGTEPASSIAGQIEMYAKDSSDGATNATLAFRTEQSVEVVGTFTPSHKHKIWINGVEYWIQLDAV